jgi:SAM-dependent methyltransferase
MSYLNLAEHYNKCFEQNGDNNLGVDWPNHNDTLIRHQIMFDLIKTNNPTVLDFGCGLAHFNEWIINNNKNIQYSGLDINENLYKACMKKYPSIPFYHKDILKDNNIPNFDYIICNGTFTEKRDLSQETMMEFFTSTIIELWDKCNEGIAFNLMSKHVDWEREDLFHVSLDELGWFLKNNLNRNFIIRNDYKLYEFTTYVYKK